MDKDEARLLAEFAGIYAGPDITKQHWMDNQNALKDAFRQFPVIGGSICAIPKLAEFMEWCEEEGILPPPGMEYRLTRGVWAECEEAPPVEFRQNGLSYDENGIEIEPTLPFRQRLRSFPSNKSWR